MESRAVLPFAADLATAGQVCCSGHSRDELEATARGRRSAAPDGATRGASSLELLSDPRVRLALGCAGLALTTVSVRRDRVGAREALVFRVVNNLPNFLHLPVWLVMQLGSLGAVPAAATAAYVADDRQLASRLLVGGTTTWALSKLVKRTVGRPRPTVLLPDTRRRGHEAAGLGYLSGHSGVAVALAVAALPRLGRRGRLVALSLVTTVGMSRLYVGAHLPLDVVGGAALGLAVDAVVTMAQRPE